MSAPLFFAEADRALFGRPADAAPPSRPPFLAGSLLTENLDAYELNITEDQLRGAPAVVQGWDTGIVSRDWERNVHKYYGDAVMGLRRNVWRGDCPP